MRPVRRGHNAQTHAGANTTASPKQNPEAARRKDAGADRRHGDGAPGEEETLCRPRPEQGDPSAAVGQRVEQSMGDEDRHDDRRDAPKRLLSHEERDGDPRHDREGNRVRRAAVSPRRTVGNAESHADDVEVRRERQCPEERLHATRPRSPAGDDPPGRHPHGHVPEARHFDRPHPFTFVHRGENSTVRPDDRHRWRHRRRGSWPSGSAIWPQRSL